MSYKRNINQFTITDFLLKLSHETWASVFEGNDVNTIFNSFLNTFLRHYYSSFPMIKVNKLLSCNSWITLGIHTICQHKRALYMELLKPHFLVLSTIVPPLRKLKI
jgi:hypothetical protein